MEAENEYLHISSRLCVVDCSSSVTLKPHKCYVQTAGPRICRPGIDKGLELLFGKVAVNLETARGSKISRLWHSIIEVCNDSLTYPSVVEPILRRFVFKGARISPDEGTLQTGKVMVSWLSLCSLQGACLAHQV